MSGEYGENFKELLDDDNAYKMHVAMSLHDIKNELKVSTDNIQNISDKVNKHDKTLYGNGTLQSRKESVTGQIEDHNNRINWLNWKGGLAITVAVFLMMQVFTVVQNYLIRKMSGGQTWSTPNRLESK